MISKLYPKKCCKII